MQVSKWGNSLAVRLPAAVVEALDLHAGDNIEIQIEGWRSLSVRKAPDNRELLRGCASIAGAYPRGSASIGWRPMSEARAFFDTNVLLYLLSADAAKADRAEAVLAEGGCIGVQVLNELAAVASRKLGLAWPEIRELLGTAQSLCRVEPLTVATHQRGLAIAERYGFSIYDSLIVAAALLAGCSLLWTEDLQDGQRIDGQLTVKNPFAAS